MNTIYADTHRSVWRERSWHKQNNSMDTTVQVGGVVYCNGVENVFLAHYGPLQLINHGLNVTAYLSTVAEHVPSFMATIYYHPMATSSPIMHHVPK